MKGSALAQALYAAVNVAECAAVGGVVAFESVDLSSLPSTEGSVAGSVTAVSSTEIALSATNADDPAECTHYLLDTPAAGKGYKYRLKRTSSNTNSVGLAIGVYDGTNWNVHALLDTTTPSHHYGSGTGALAFLGNLAGLGLLVVDLSIDGDSGLGKECVYGISYTIPPTANAPIGAYERDNVSSIPTPSKIAVFAINKGTGGTFGYELERAVYDVLP